MQVCCIGDRIAQRRKIVGLSPRKLAELLGLERMCVYRWERRDVAKRSEPNLRVLPQLADALQVSIDWLVCGHESRFAGRGSVAPSSPKAKKRARA